ncbi:MAG: Holliday junction branch migration protein RuvA [Candidatus Nealsonbacteria bacterium]|nr:Holliday junction branch migration protein RuvA [Candidatus Nealsonbacteria bacterium]
MYNTIMISYLKGKISKKSDKFVVILVGNIGFKVFMSKKALFGLNAGNEIEVFCFLNVKENILDLYGFLNQDELDFFGILESIRGIGPKAALEISSLGPLNKIRERILKNDEKLFEGIPGIGKKKAMTIILELTGKIRAFKEQEKDEDVGEVESALMTLGFSKAQAKDAVKKIPKEISDAEGKIKYVLKSMAKPSL